MIDRRRASGARGSLGATSALLWLLVSALACTTAPHRGSQPGAGAGGAAAGMSAGTTAGSAAAAGEASGAGGAGGEGGAAAPDSTVADSTVPNPPVGGGAAAPDGGAGAGGAPGPTDASTLPRDATWEDAPQSPECPPLLPAFDEYCNREGLSCSYGMECCPDLAFCEYSRWTLLTHHCDACP